MDIVVKSLCHSFILNKKHSDDNFGDILAKLGVGWMKRKLASSATPEISFTMGEHNDRAALIINSKLMAGVTKIFYWYVDGNDFTLTDEDTGVVWTSRVVCDGDALVSYRSNPKTGTLKESRRMITVDWSNSNVQENVMSFFEIGSDPVTDKPSVICTRYLEIAS